MSTMFQNPIVTQIKEANTDQPENVALDLLLENHMQNVVGECQLSKHARNKWLCPMTMTSLTVSFLLSTSLDTAPPQDGRRNFYILITTLLMNY